MTSLARFLCGTLLLTQAGCRAISLLGLSSPSSGAPPLARYLDLPRAIDPSLSPDGQRLAFLSDLPGLPQPYRLELGASGEPPANPSAFLRMATLPHRVQVVRWLGDKEEALLGYDRGGSENTQFSLLNTDTRGMTPLTDQPAVRHLFGAIHPDGTRLVYASNERNKKDFDLMLRELHKPEAARRLLEGKGHLEPRGFSPDGKRLLVTEHLSGASQNLHQLTFKEDGSVSAWTQITTNTDEARNEEACYIGPLVLSLSDLGREHLSLVLLRPEFPQIGTIPILNEPVDIERLACSPSGDRFAVASNVQGRHQLRVYKIAKSTSPPGSFPLLGLPFPLPAVLPQAIPTGTFPLAPGVDFATQPPPEQALLVLHGRSALVEFPAHHLPSGVIRTLSFSRDGSTLAVQLGRATEPDQIWTIHTDDGATTQRTSAGELMKGLPAMAEPELVQVKSFDEVEIPVFFHKPAGKSGEKFPAVVWVHGGPESQYQPSFSPLIQAMLARGIAVAAPNVRGSTGYGKRYSHLDDVEKREDSVKDLAAVNRWLRERDDIDGQHLAVMGGSYGGYMVLATMTTNPELWAAGVDVVGIANFETFLRNTAPYRRAQREAEYGRLEGDQELLKRLSPIHKIEKIQAPLFVIHGANDPRVPIGEAEQIVTALQQRNHPVTYLRFDDEGHGLSRRENQIKAYGQVLEFLGRTLRPGG